MSSPIIQLIVLAAIAIFLILRLRDVLGTREGFEKPVVSRSETEKVDNRNRFEVIEGGPDTDITDHIEEPDSVEALTKMKKAEPSFGVSDFLGGARGAYEMILMAFEAGDLAKIKPFLSDEVYDSFAAVVEQREKDGYKIEANFVGLRELKLVEAEFDEQSKEGDITIRFVGELTSVVRDKAGEIIEGNPKEVKRQKDVWTFSRIMGSSDPNWQLVATGG
ncbi:Tim44/TimA family putative adaptor protein [Maritimibacter sp. UBA3975]|uniref:Tim44/TimA family putative adaptor protein n=1 Tax=Maritimibacter sp. UBA3975 TaxID=1946833 RepID=UPI000C09EC8B|nr:Tim44/TimA family putative adaptor protein [Maritimibacter sp. UBA3975]MAM63447.1 preprotein translocase subunit Tim44 [Maritimibacter sp.]|tara:strand:+ start:30925 stop:31584 length:660 start_codon:yes stop_codon:yes gene_type:complete